MKVEVPDLRRCCFCIPLRKGILAWAYFKLIYTIGFALMYTNVMTFAIMMGGFRTKWETFFFITIFLLIIGDIVFTNVLIVGGHTKSHKLLRICFVYGIINLILQFLAMLTQVIQIALASHLRNRVRYLSVTVISGTAYILFNAYIILLVRSEMRKLKNECKIEFVNNAAESECAMIPEGSSTE